MFRYLLVLSLILFAQPLLAACKGKSGFWSLPDEQQRQLQDRASRAPFSEGILWQVEKDGITSYLVGTMHLFDPRHETILRRLEPLLNQTVQIFLETTSDQETAFQKRLSTDPKLILLTEGPSLIDLLGQESWDKLLPAIKARGLPGFIAAKYQPWFLGLTLSIPACAIQDLKLKKTGLDRLVETAAQTRGTLIRSLDDMDALIRLFAEDPIAKQVEGLKWSLQFDLTAAMSGGSDLTDHYFREEIQLGWDFLVDKTVRQYGERPEDREKITTLLNEMMEKLVEGRNRTWFEILSVELARTPTFVAVGALHLPGENGVLALLQRDGFEITRLPLSDG
ncbi:TraB family protein [Thalassovita gelatinovora]|uniref:TraB family protein n=1 Tax=Thalassovita gelatinovora TaxID=53501 RepID=A0A0P1F8M4_THAGE|nr:TraB/GumN family protein [Thalassovita gelatinovora]QIZ81372.1 TraB/GumN family protein [Thalassovita gelatinovora]CUH64428.1 TraB family protein [Thalassovita gelatinovora]SEP98953.1 hypothetical protein SAMN04488043_102406 [Thalassovita gelatinovora]